MYEITTAGPNAQFLIEQGPYIVQLLALGTLCGWTARRLVGSSLNIRGLQVFFGLAGLHAGSWLWQSFSWHPGPMVGNFSLLASLAGAITLFACLRLFEVAVAATAKLS